MREDDSADPFIVVLVEDSEDARLFVELSSHAADLAEAAHALQLAVQGDDSASPMADARAFLIGFAATAYCRSFTISNVRGRLTDHVGVPEKFAATHKDVRNFRNATIAHSQSELSVTYASGVLDADTLNVRDVMAATFSSTLPRAVVHEFRALVEVMATLLDDVLFPVRQRLQEQLGGISRSEVLARRRPTVIDKFVYEFDPKTTRAAYPTSHTVYWEPIADEDAPDPATDVLTEDT